MELMDLIEFVVGGFFWATGAFFSDFIWDSIFGSKDDDDGDDDHKASPPPKKKKGKRGFRRHYIAPVGFLIATGVLGCSTQVPPTEDSAKFGVSLVRGSGEDYDFTVRDLNRVLKSSVEVDPHLQPFLKGLKVHVLEDTEDQSDEYRGWTDVWEGAVYTHTFWLDKEADGWQCHTTLSHEFYHWFFFKVFRDPDYTHAAKPKNPSERGPEPWGKWTNERIQEANLDCHLKYQPAPES